MEPLNRFALIVRPKRRYLEWANTLREKDESPLTLEQLSGFQEVYLLDASDPDVDREDVIDRYADDIWEQQLSGWTSDEAAWPSNRTPHTLRDWFELLFIEMVFDADPEVDLFEPESDAAAVEAESRICQWCQTVVEDDEPVLSLSFTLPEVAKESTADPLVPVMIGGKPRIAIRAQPGSEAARAGHDLIFTFCSETCVNEMRDALRRERAALLS